MRAPWHPSKVCAVSRPCGWPWKSNGQGRPSVRASRGGLVDLLCMQQSCFNDLKCLKSLQHATTPYNALNIYSGWNTPKPPNHEFKIQYIAAGIQGCIFTERNFKSPTRKGVSQLRVSKGSLFRRSCACRGIDIGSQLDEFQNCGRLCTATSEDGERPGTSW